MDKCKNNNGVQPAPQNSEIVGLTFDKQSPKNYKENCDIHRYSLNNPMGKLVSAIINFKSGPPCSNNCGHICPLKGLLLQDLT